MQNLVNRIIYTGFVRANNDDYRSLDRWKIKALGKIQKFADYHGELVVVGDNDFLGFYNDIVSGGCCEWKAGTLTSIWAINEFSKSKYDQMLWLDLDCTPSIYAQWPEENIWLTQYNKNYSFNDDFSQQKAKFFWDYVVPRVGPIEKFGKVKSSMFSINKSTAQRMIDFLNLKGLNPIENRNLYVSDESILEAFFSYNVPQDTSKWFDDYPDITGKTFVHYGHSRKII